ncbi:unnamed protein product [Clavelina lepadiformis]|uniref:Vomeronasal type-1 receptor n=1 Tax=Clavelina lepadiformis TaxID=159417 RepID=A0ABP0G5W6_CLALP
MDSRKKHEVHLSVSHFFVVVEKMFHFIGGSHTCSKYNIPDKYIATPGVRRRVVYDSGTCHWINVIQHRDDNRVPLPLDKTKPSSFVPSLERSTFPVFPTLMMGASILTQTAYTVLFCVTLKIHEKANKIAANSKTQSSRKITQRCFYFAVAAVLTDCINTVSISATISIIPEVYVNLFPKLDLFINLLCMLFCFNTLPGVMKKIVHMITCGKISFGDEDKVVANHQTARTTVPSISAVVQA